MFAYHLMYLCKQSSIDPSLRAVRRDGREADAWQPAAAVPRDDGQAAAAVAEPRPHRRGRPQVIQLKE